MSQPDPTTAAPTDADIVDATRVWLEKAVIGLNLCPFAKAVHARRQIRYVVSHATDDEALLGDLLHELQLLASADPGDIETTLLIHPGVLTDFLDYNAFLDVADAARKALGLKGVVQIPGPSTYDFPIEVHADTRMDLQLDPAIETNNRIYIIHSSGKTPLST